MKRIFLLSSLILASLLSIAQTQQGFVKTKGRMVNGQHVPGQGLKGATVSIKDRTPVVVQNGDGSFSFPIPSKTFMVTDVQKNSYQLVDNDAIRNSYSYSSNPIYLVMETPEQQLQDQLNAERKIRRTLTNQLHQREDEIEALKEQQKITDEEYRQALQKLYEDTDQNEQLVKDMVERYSKIDYDQLNEFDQLISNYILNGELTKADSLLRTKGNINERISVYRKHEAINAKEREELAERQEQLEQSEALAIQERNDLANDCYRKFEIFKMQHENDSAAFYLELRAALDSTELEWGLEYGRFITTYLANYDIALQVFQNIFRRSIELYGENNIITVDCINDLGYMYNLNFEHTKALEYYEKALSIKLIMYGENHPDVALGYNNLGSLLSEIGKYDDALKCLKKTIDIYKLLFGDNNLGVAKALSNIGRLYWLQSNYLESLNYFEDALNINKTILGENTPEVASVYLSLSDTYFKLGDYDKALEYTTRALPIFESVYGETHPALSRTYRSFGDIYTELNSSEKTIDYFTKALSIDIIIFGLQHPNIVEDYNSIGVLLLSQNRNEESLCYFQKALDIAQNTNATDLQMLQLYNNIGTTYNRLKNCELAVFYLEKTLNASLTVREINNLSIGTIHNNLGKAYFNCGDFEKALMYYNNALNILLPLFGEDSPNIAPIYYNIGETLFETGEFDNALKSLHSALVNFKNSLPEGHPKTIKTENKISEVKAKMKEAEKK